MVKANHQTERQAAPVHIRTTEPIRDNMALFLRLEFIVPLFASLVTLTQATVVTNDTSVAANQTFDYVIVGAGLTGITVGNKLSEKGYLTLIIEAGPDPRWNSAIYNAEGRVQHDPYCNWLYPAYDENGTLFSQAIDSGACIGGSTSSKSPSIRFAQKPLF